MKRNLMIVAGCGMCILSATLLSVNAADSSVTGEQSCAVNHRNQQYDANKDGKLDSAEIATMKADRAEKRKARLLAKYDANKNGAIDPEEESVRQADLAKRRQQRAERKKAKEAEKAAAAAAAPTTAEEDDDEEDAPKP